MTISQQTAIAYAFELFVYATVAGVLTWKVIRNRFRAKPFRPFVASIAGVLWVLAATVAYRLYLRIGFIVTGEVNVAGSTWIALSILGGIAVSLFYVAFRYAEDKLRDC